MANHRVLQYEGTSYHVSTGSSHTQLYPFTEAQAREAGTVLETDGIDIVTAQRLCEQWTRRGQGKSIRYSYRIPFCRAPKPEDSIL